MDYLGFRTIRHSSRSFGEGVGSGTGTFDVFFVFDLPHLAADHIALLSLSVRDVAFERNWISINWPGMKGPDLASNFTFDQARNSPNFVSRIFSNPTDHYVPQLHQIDSGFLKAQNNGLGIHSRSESGAISGNRDNFTVARIFIHYYRTGP